jgi:hypothetical protein
MRIRQAEPIQHALNAAILAEAAMQRDETACEAFAAQVLCTLRAWESAEFCRERHGLPAALGSIDRAKLNVNGSSIAVGHPFAATGTRIVATLAKLLATTPAARRGLISVCTAGGMGVRCFRFGMIVDDGVVKYIGVEASGKFEVSNVEAILSRL